MTVTAVDDALLAELERERAELAAENDRLRAQLAKKAPKKKGRR